MLPTEHLEHRTVRPACDTSRRHSFYCGDLEQNLQDLQGLPVKPIANEQKINSTTQGKTAQQDKRDGLLIHAITQWKAVLSESRQTAHTVWFCSYKTLGWSISSLMIKTGLPVAWARGSDDWQRRGTTELLEMPETFRILILLLVTQVTTGMLKLIRMYMHTTVPKLNLNKTS